MATKKEYVRFIELATGETIEQRDEYSWNLGEMTDGSLNEAIALNKVFVSYTDKDKVEHLIRITDIRSVKKFIKETPEEIAEAPEEISDAS